MPSVLNDPPLEPTGGGMTRRAFRGPGIVLSFLAPLAAWLGWKALFLLPAVSIVATVLVLVGAVGEQRRPAVSSVVRAIFLVWLCLTIVATVMVPLDSFSNENLAILSVLWCVALFTWILDQVVEGARSAVWVGGLAALIVISVSAWQLIAARSELTPFQENASRVCRDEIPKIRSTKDPQAARTAGAEMRRRLAELTPPADQQGVYSQYLAALKGADDAIAAGDHEQEKYANYYIERNAAELGIETSCSMPYR